MTEYVELHCHSYYSLLDGATSPDALVARAAEIGMRALALTDHDALYGAVPFVRAAREQGVQPILGAELTLADAHHLTLLVTNEEGWRNLCWLISHAQENAPKGRAALPLGALENHTSGLIALTGCRRGALMQALHHGDRQAARRAALWLCERFGSENSWIELQHHLRLEDNRLIKEGVALAETLGLQYIATNNVHYAKREAYRLQDVLVCIRHGMALDEAVHLRRFNSEYYLKSGEELAHLFAAYPAALHNTLRLAERCTFDLPMGLQALPTFPTPANVDADAYLRQLSIESLAARYPFTPDEARAQVEHELGVIRRSNLANYFLVVWDVVRFAREQGIRCQGRGSACNSLVAYLLGISPIDPLAHALVFERFLSDERQAVPDIDLDLQADRREEVIQYLYKRYGHNHTAMACTFITFGARSALRDIGKVLGIPPDMLSQITRVLDGREASALAHSPELQARAAEGEVWQQLAELCQQIAGFPRHLGLHNGGMVITRDPLNRKIPIEPAAMTDRTVVQWDKEMLEDVGIIKLDLLGLRMLSVLAEAACHIEHATGTPISLETLPFNDEAVYEMITRADTVGVFQVESRAQAQVLPRLRPRCFDDLIISISLIRPGPIQGAMVHPYLRRRCGEEPVTYTHPLLEPALRETLGVILFQEQVLKVARDLAGFTAGQGEQLRRALGKKRVALLEQFRSAFLQGAQSKGVPVDTAETVWEQLRAFGGYSFAKSHAAAFAVLVYQSAWVKRYHPAAFFTALLNQQPMGFWSPSVLIGDAKRQGVEILPVDINQSEVRCTFHNDSLRLGLSYVNDIGEIGGQRVVSARGTSRFENLLDFCRRTQLPRRVVEQLIMAGAMDGWQLPRRQLLWELGLLRYREAEFELRFPDDGVRLPPLSALETLLWEREVMGLSPGDHLLALYRPWLQTHGIIGSKEVEHSTNGRQVRVAGQKVMHQAPPTARGVHFLTLEDEDGLVNVVVRPDVYQRYRPLLRRSPLLLVEGSVQRKNSVVNLVAERVVPLQLQ